MNRGIVEFYYTRTLPAHAVAIAKIATSAATPAQLTDVNNTPYQTGSLGVWKTGTDLASPADFMAVDYGVPVHIAGSLAYKVANQFFELTNRFTAAGTPLFFQHAFSSPVTQVTILDLTGRIVAADVVLENNVLYHALDGAPYRVRYVDGPRVSTSLLRYDLVLRPAVYAPSATTYVFGGRAVQVATTETLALRFLKPNGYRVTPPYNALPNVPWFARVGYSLTPPAPEWARQLFLPARPYVAGTWIPGTVLDAHLLEFDRKAVWDDPTHLPDILVFDSAYQIKYAVEGSDRSAPKRRGSVYHWKRGQITGIDPTNARVEIALELAPDDIVFGFYSYREPDVLYTALDLNPFTNPDVKNRVVQFSFKADGVDPFRTIYHQVLTSDGTPIAGQTNDPDPTVGTSVEFARLVVGASVGVPQITIEDVRQRGGGLALPHQTLPEAVNFWDLGYWDGKPYPIGAALVIYLPTRLLDGMSRDDVVAKAQAVLPLGVTAVVRFYDPDGEER